MHYLRWFLRQASYASRLIALRAHFLPAASQKGTSDDNAHNIPGHSVIFSLSQSCAKLFHPEAFSSSGTNQ
jgi:hypothetical protein